MAEFFPVGDVSLPLDLTHLQALHHTPRLDVTTMGQKHSRSSSLLSPLVALRLLSSLQADSSAGYLSIIVLIPGEWSMAGNGCILSWPGIVAVITQQVGPSAASPQCYTRAEITPEENRGIPSLCPASGPVMWSPLSLSRGQLYSPPCGGDHPSIVTFCPWSPPASAHDGGGTQQTQAA